MARAVTIRFTGVARLNSQMMRSADGVQSGAARGVRQLTNQAMRISQLLVPVDTGALKATGRTYFVKVGYSYRGSILYGGASYPQFVDYAVYVHEILENKHAPPTQAKFVETAYHMAEAAAGQTIKQYVAGALVRSFGA